MSTCGFTIQIDPSSYLGDSLSTINSNTSSLDINSNDSLNLLTYLSDQISLMDTSLLNINNTLYQMITSKNNAITNYYLVTSSTPLFVTPLAIINTNTSNNFNYQTGTFTTGTTIPSATLLLLSGVPVGCTNNNGSILFTIDGIPVTTGMLPVIKKPTYNYSWYYTSNCINQTYKIYLMGGI